MVLGQPRRKYLELLDSNDTERDAPLPTTEDLQQGPNPLSAIT